MVHTKQIVTPKLRILHGPCIFFPKLFIGEVKVTITVSSLNSKDFVKGRRLDKWKV